MLAHHYHRYARWLATDPRGIAYAALSASPTDQKVIFAQIARDFRQLLLALTENYRDIHCSWLPLCLSQFSSSSHRLTL